MTEIPCLCNETTHDETIIPFRYMVIEFGDLKDGDYIEHNGKLSKIKRMAIKGPQMIIQLESNAIFTGLLDDKIAIHRTFTI